MDQEKFASLNQPSNANMPRDTVETLKQIQKQGLSISIVPSNSGSFTLPLTTSADNRPKQSVLTVDKPKILPRPQTTTENKTQLLQARLISSADTRVSSGRVTTQPTFHDSKAPSNQIRPIQPAVSESKSFNQVWSGPNTSNGNKSQGTTSRPVPIPSANKIQTSQVRLNQIHIPENKTPVNRSGQGMLTENKNQGRVIPGPRVTQNQQLIEGKILNNDRISVNTTSTPDAKVFSNQIRIGQQFGVSQESKAAAVQRVVAQKAAEGKIVNQLNTNKQTDVKTSQPARVIQTVKVLPEPNQGKVRQNYAVKPDGKPSNSGNTSMILENKTVRLVTNVVEGSATRTTQCKSSSTQMRLHPSASGAETPTAVQTKMICTTAVTKMICYVPGQLENKMILQNAKVAASASDVIQKTSTMFDMSSEASHGKPITSKIAAKRSTTLFSPAKRKCLKKIAPNSAEMSGKSQDGSNLTSSEEGNENEDQFFSNLKTSRTGLTITPVRSTTTVPIPGPKNSVGVTIPGEFLNKDMYRLTWENAAMVATPTAKGRARGRRKYVEPVCLTLSSDDEEEHMQAPFNSIEEAIANQAHMFPQESEEGSKSGQSSPVYQDEDNPESDDPQFPGVTDIHQKSAEERLQYEDDEEDEEDKEMEDMEMEEEEESMGEEEEDEMDDSELEDEEEEEVPPEEEDEQVLTKGPLENMSCIEEPLQCRSVRIGSFRIHAKTVGQTVQVFLSMDGISFNAPTVTDPNKILSITLKSCDVTQMLVHFGKCLPIVFIFTTQSFAEVVRKSLNMTGVDSGFFDPSSNDEKQKKITFLIDCLTEEQRRFLRFSFVNDKKVRELDQKTANEILVKSTPSQNQFGPNDKAPFPNSVDQFQNVPPPVPPIPPPPPPPLQMKLITPPQPVTKLFTYPPPPQTGGIAITSEDLACLNEGEFLNDAIIDFYLKYVFYEKLSDYHREKTHIFSSYFYPRLTHKPERARAGDDGQKNVQTRRHSQVKTWTRHVDIFSKDFIIIPVNQNVHWFLAIICYPGLVPEATECPPKIEPKNNKSSDNVTSTDDQEENKSAKEPNSTVDGNNQNSDENSTASSNSMFEQEEPDSEEPMPEAPDSSTHPDKNRRRKEAPCICIFDSLNGPNRSRIVTMLREYLEIEWKMKKGTRKVFDKNTMQGFIMQCPQQTNYSDCGIYVLQYVESFFENPIPYFDSPIPNLSNWFAKEKMASKRQELKDLLLILQKKHSSNTSIRKASAPDSVPSSPAQMVQTDNR